MLLHNFFTTHMPYCLDLQQDGRYVVLNREYKPIGFHTEDFIKYSDFPVSVNFKKLSPGVVAQLSVDGNSDPSRIHLYCDSYQTLTTPLLMNAYLKRLRLLMSWEVKKSPAKRFVNLTNPHK